MPTLSDYKEGGNLRRELLAGDAAYQSVGNF